LLSKLTTAAAVSFMITSISLSILASRDLKGTGGSVLPEDAPAAETQQIPSPGSTPALPADPPAEDTDVDDDPATSD
jgi:hypothetical protein